MTEKAKKIILAVDDMPMNLATLKTILQKEFDLRPSKSAKTAFALLEVVKPDLILLDVEMPEMSGFEFLERLGRRDIPVIFVTSHGSEDFIARAKLSGVRDYVTKPVVPAVLLEKIRTVLAGGKFPGGG
jgi:putative two-component system response regulator